MQPSSPGGRWNGSSVSRQRRAQEGLLLCALAVAAALLLWVEGEAVWTFPVLVGLVVLVLTFVMLNRGYGIARTWAVVVVAGCGLPAAVVGWIWYGDGMTVAALAAAMVVAADFLVARMAFARPGAPSRYGR